MANFVLHVLSIIVLVLTILAMLVYNLHLQEQLDAAKQRPSIFDLQSCERNAELWAEAWRREMRQCFPNQKEPKQ